MCDISSNFHIHSPHSTFSDVCGLFLGHYSVPRQPLPHVLALPGMALSTWLSSAPCATPVVPALL